MSYSRTAPKLISALAVLALLTPLLVWDRTLYPFVFGKVWLFRILVEAMAVLYMPLAASNPEFRPKKSFVWLALCVFFLSLVLSSIFGASFSKSFWSNAERMEGLFGIFHYMFFALILSGIFRMKPERFYGLMKVFLGVGVLSIVAGIFRALDTGYLRLEGTAGNPSFFASLLIFEVLFAALLALHAQSRREKYIYGALAIVFAVGTFGTGTRGAFLGLAVGFLIYAALMLFGKMSFSKTRIAYIGAILLLVAGGVWISKGRDISLSDPNVRSRLTAIRISVSAWREHPWLGWGFESYNVAFNKHIDPKLISEFRARQWFDRAHNKMLDMLVMGGIVGLAAYLLFLGSLVWAFLQTRRKSYEDGKAAFIGIAGLAAYTVHNLFVFDVHQSYLPLFLLISFLAASTETKKGFGDSMHSAVARITFQNSNFKVPMSTSLLFGIILFIPLFWYASVKPLRAAMAIYNAFSLDPSLNARAPKNISQDIRVRAIIGEYQIAIAQNSYVTWEALLLLERYYVGEVRAGNIPVDEELLTYLADRLYEATYREPLKYEAYLAIGEILNIRASLGDAKVYEEAGEAIEKAIALAPNVPRVWYAKGTLLFGLKKTTEGIEAFKMAVALNPDIVESHITLANAYLFLSEYRNAADVLDEAQKKGYEPGSVSEFKQLFEAYSETVQYEKVEKVLLRLIELEPKSAKWHAVLAATYKGMQRYGDARSEVARAVELDESYAREAEIFLKMLPK
ncbi:MAG: O-antigen ligase family protein [bacterium]|nr:O-antigen ligase family protein [bacterium]